MNNKEQKAHDNYKKTARGGNMKYKRLTAIVLITIISINVFAGCSQSKSTAKNKEKTSNKDLRGNIEISVSRDKFGDYIQGDIISSFKKKYPDIQVNISNIGDIDSRVNSGKTPDIYIGDKLYEATKYGEMGKLIDFEKLKGFKDLSSKIQKKYITKKQNNNNVYSIPWFVTTELMAYNKALLREAGLDENKPPKTFDELLNYADKIYRLPNRVDGSKIYGIGTDADFKAEAILNWQTISPIYYNMNNSKYRLYNNTGTDIAFDKPEAKLAEVFGLLSSVQRLGTTDLKNTNLNNVGIWLQYGDEQNTTNKEIGIDSIPVNQAGGESYSTLKSKNIMIFKSDKNREDIAWEFVQYIMGEEKNLAACKTLKELPVLSNLMKNKYFNSRINKKYIKQLDNSVPLESFISIDNVTLSIQKNYIDYYMSKNKITPQSAIKKAAGESRNIIKNAGE